MVEEQILKDGPDDRSPGHRSGNGERRSSALPHPFTFPIRLSQGQLNLLSTCPRKFQHIYLEQLATPATPEQQEKMIWGSRFHLLMQQWQLGLPVDRLVKEDSQLQPWFSAFMAAAPQILKLDAGETATHQYSEYSLTIAFQGYLLTVVYDLLISNQNQAKILDWKTYPRPQNPGWLQQNWQTRLYLFTLAEMGSYLPEQISMTYWFFQVNNPSAPDPQSVTIAYDTTRHEKNRRDLTALLNQLTDWLERYQAGEPFPQVSPSANQCAACHFAVRCDRAVPRPETGASPQPVQSPTDRINDFSIPNLAEIQEIEL
jgi:hypothetical protein